MTTTMEKFAGEQSRNYCTLPTIDVEILPDVSVCKECRHEIVSVHVPLDNGRGYEFTHQLWVHAQDPAAYEVRPVGEFPRVKATGDHWASPATRCSYCHTNDPEAVSFVQHAWYDGTHCTRCGGVSGFGIGD